MASPPIVIYKPRLVVESYDAVTGLLSGVDAELTDDVSVVEIGVDTPVSTVTTFAGKFQTPQTPEPSATVGVVATEGLSARWAPVVGKFAQLRVYDRTDADHYRAFDTIIPVNPSLYGSTDPEEPREVELTLPVLSAVTEGDDV